MIQCTAVLDTVMLGNGSTAIPLKLGIQYLLSEVQTHCCVFVFCFFVMMKVLVTKNVTVLPLHLAFKCH